MFLAFAELRRSLGRFTLLGGAVGLLVLLLLFFQAVAGALTGGLTGAYEAGDTDVWVYDDAARRNPQASVVDDGVADAVAGVDGVAVASPVTFTVFDVGDEPTAVIAVEPDSPALPAELSSGSAIADSGDAILAVSGFVAAPPTDGLELAGVPVDVVGEAEGATFNVLPTLFTTRDVVAEATEARAGAPVPLPTSAIAVTVADGVDPVTLAADITGAVDGVEAVDAATAVTSLPGAGTITRSFSILYVLLYLVVAIVTAVFFQILTVQKRDALVLLRAVGARRRDVVVPVLVQVVMVVGVAVLVGAGIATGLLTALQDVFGAGLDPTTVVTSSVAILVLGLLAGLLSVRRILRIEPVEAVRGGGLA
nr:FtsX-like permease family protein [Salsipaludibacter albus]